jgi:hypothetical protein
MNLRIVSFLSSDSEEEVKELVADFAESLLKRGFANDVEDTSSALKSLIIVRENEEVLNGAPEEFFQEELSKALMTVIPTDVTGVHTEQPEQEEESD